MLGRLEKVALRDIWASEAHDFTPWLAESTNLQILSEALHLELELEAQEKSVGPFRADMLCKTVGDDDHWVLIENQLERTDHNHLGQLLTYASGLDAVTIIWIADRFTEEHRSTLDWLNRITDESFRFFGLEVEVWKIGSSLAAPKFNVVSKPNNWSKAVARGAKAIAEGELSDLKKLQISYWDELHAVLNKSGGSVARNRKAQPQGWMSYSIGKTNVSVSAAINSTEKVVRAEIYLTGHTAKDYFFQLFEHQQNISDALGFKVSWDELPNGIDSRIVTYLMNSDPTDKSDWLRQHEWLSKHLNALHRVFSPYVRNLG
jgi:hypothetical protein